MFKKILLALDGSAGARRALTLAVDLAKTYEASLTVLSAEEHLPSYAATIGEIEEWKAREDAYFERVQREALDLAAERGVDAKVEVHPGHAAETIVRVAGEGAYDLVVLGSKGHSFVRDFFLGSTADKVSHHAPCTVMIVK